MHYRVVVSTPCHGELFEARGDEQTIVKVLEAAVAAAQSVEEAIQGGGIALSFEVTVRP